MPPSARCSHYGATLAFDDILWEPRSPGQLSLGHAHWDSGAGGIARAVAEKLRTLRDIAAGSIIVGWFAAVATPWLRTELLADGFATAKSGRNVAEFVYVNWATLEFCAYSWAVWDAGE